MSHQPKNPPCANEPFGCDNQVAEEGECCAACEAEAAKHLAHMEREYRAEQGVPNSGTNVPKTGICARCKDNTVADPETGDSECCGASVLDGSDLVDRAEMLMEDR